jgi:hypothetical protein
MDRDSRLALTGFLAVFLSGVHDLRLERLSAYTRWWGTRYMRGYFLGEGAGALDFFSVAVRYLQEP